MRQIKMIHSDFSADEMRKQLREIYEDMRKHASYQLAELRTLSDCEVQSLFTCVMLEKVEFETSESDSPFSLN